MIKRFCAATIAFLQLLLGCAIGFACTQEFDKTPPAAIRGQVVNELATFEWGSDVDIVHGKLWITNYILNLGTRGLGAVWTKAKIRVPSVAPIARHEIFCHRYLIDAFRSDPDPDAPIIYGTNRQREGAAAFVAQSLTQPVRSLPPTASGSEATSIIATTIRDQTGEPRPIHVEVSTRPTAKGVRISIGQSANLVIGLSLLANVLTSQQQAHLSNSAMASNAIVQRGSLVDFVKHGDEAFIEEIFDESELNFRRQEEYWFFSGADNMHFEIDGTNFRNQPAKMVVFDQSKRPLFVVDIGMLMPSR